MPLRQRIYKECLMDSAEDVEKYIPGGLHPVSINQILGDGRYKILHKLGSGGLATVWLTRDLQHDPQKCTTGSLVSLKVQRADESPETAEESFEVAIPRKLVHLKPKLRSQMALPLDSFIERGPNGNHLCVVSELAGSNLSAISNCPGRIAGTRRLRAPIARKVCGQIAIFVREMHPAGSVHGDLTVYNILLRLKDEVDEWADEKVYTVLGDPNLYKVRRVGEQPPEPHAPTHIVENIPAKVFAKAGILGDDVVIIDFGKSFEILEKPSDYQPAAVAHYRAPEISFDKAFTTATDVWCLGCLLFEIRAGHSLFESCFCTADNMLHQIVTLLGKLPELWWSNWTGRSKFYHESGEPLNPPDEQERRSIRDWLRAIGENDFEHPFQEGGGVIETSGTYADEDETALLGDLLEKMVRLRPEERISMEEVVQHPWFAYHPGNFDRNDPPSAVSG